MRHRAGLPGGPGTDNHDRWFSRTIRNCVFDSCATGRCFLGSLGAIITIGGWAVLASAIVFSAACATGLGFVGALAPTMTIGGLTVPGSAIRRCAAAVL